jgi:methyltransferase (TIGR00027 family)
MAREPSKTAAGVALLRAAHQLFDDSPRILDDPVALRLLGPDGVEALRQHADAFAAPGSRGLRAHIVIRSRFAEDRLADAVQRGVRQYVILGAGGDTFAYRQPEWAGDLRVVEVDHPATQEPKRAHLAACGVVVPENVIFAPVDFEEVPLHDALLANGVDLSEPVFFSWLGVTMYLTEAAVDATLRVVAGCARSSEIVFTFAQPPGLFGSRRLAKMAASVGEPWLSYFTPKGLEKKLRTMGFSTVYFLTPDDTRARYIARRTDRLPVPRRTSVVSAIV